MSPAWSPHTPPEASMLPWPPLLAYGRTENNNHRCGWLSILKTFHLQVCLTRLGLRGFPCSKSKSPPRLQYQDSVQLWPLLHAKNLLRLPKSQIWAHSPVHTDTEGVWRGQKVLLLLSLSRKACFVHSGVMLLQLVQVKNIKIVFANHNRHNTGMFTFSFKLLLTSP